MITFTYTKANKESSERICAVLEETDTFFFCVDLTSYDTPDKKRLADNIEYDPSGVIKALDLMKYYRKFLKANISNLIKE
jgi:hypothetical protein